MFKRINTSAHRLRIDAAETIRHSGGRRRPIAFESLEDRVLLDVGIGSIPPEWTGGDAQVQMMSQSEPTLFPIGTLTVPTGKTLFVPLEVTSGQGSMTFAVESDNPNVQAEIVTGGRSLRLTVAGDGFTGDLVFRLFEEDAPNTTARIIELVESGFYDGLTFHRIIDGFVAQGGDPDGTGAGGSGVTFDDEFHYQYTFTGFGQLAMANAGDDTNDSQFFITDLDLNLADPDAQPPQHLNFAHTIFGQLTGGLEVFDQLITTPASADGAPSSPVVITSATIFEDSTNGLLKLTSTAGQTESAQVTLLTVDSADAQSTTTFQVDVVSDVVDDPPYLGPIANPTTVSGQPVELALSAFDIDGDLLTFFILDPDTLEAPDNVLVSINQSAGRATLTPDANFTGTIELFVAVQQSDGGFDSQMITLDVLSPSVSGAGTNGPVTLVEEGDSLYIDGDAGDVVTLRFDLLMRDAAMFNEAGVFVADDATGAVNGVAPGTPEYAMAAMTSAHARVVFARGAADGTATEITFAAGDYIGIYLVQDNSFDAADDGSAPVTYFTFVDANSDGFDHVHSLQVNDTQFEFAWEDLDGGGDKDFNDLIMRVSVAADKSAFTVPGHRNQTVPATFTINTIEAGLAFEVGIFRVDDLRGQFGNLQPSNVDYARTVLSSDSVQTLFATGAASGSSNVLDLTGGGIMGMYLIVGGSRSDLLSQNPDNDLVGGSPVAYFVFADANPDNAVHGVRLTLDQFGFETLLDGGDELYDDLTLNVQLGSPVAS